MDPSRHNSDAISRAWKKRQGPIKKKSKEELVQQSQHILYIKYKRFYIKIIKAVIESPNTYLV